MKKCCFKWNLVVIIYSIYHLLTGLVDGMYRPYLFYVLYEQLPQEYRFLLLGCLLCTELFIDWIFDYACFIIQRNIKDRRLVLMIANVFDILSCVCYFFLNDVHWALVFAGAGLHSLSMSISNGTHQAIVAWWLVEIDGTKYRNYFLNHRYFYELIGTLLGVVLGYYIHVHLYDSIFGVVNALNAIESGRKHRAIFLIASIVYLIKILFLMFHPKQKFLINKFNSETKKSIQPDGYGDDVEQQQQQQRNPIATNNGHDAAMEGVKSKKEYMERNRRIFREKFAKEEVKSDMYDDLGKFWFEDEKRTCGMDLMVIGKILRSSIGRLLFNLIPYCICSCYKCCLRCLCGICSCCRSCYKLIVNCCPPGYEDADDMERRVERGRRRNRQRQQQQRRHRRGYDDDDDDDDEYDDSDHDFDDDFYDDDMRKNNKANPLEIYLPVRKLVEISVFRAVQYHMKDFIQAGIIIYPFLTKYNAPRNGTTTSIGLCVVYFFYAIVAYISQYNSKRMRTFCGECCDNYPTAWKSRKIIQTCIRSTTIAIFICFAVGCAQVSSLVTILWVVMHIVVHMFYGFSSSHSRYMIGKMAKRYIGNERGSLESGVKFLSTIFLCIISPLFGYSIDQDPLQTPDAWVFSRVSKYVYMHFFFYFLSYLY